MACLQRIECIETQDGQLTWALEQPFTEASVLLVAGILVILKLNGMLRADQTVSGECLHGTVRGYVPYPKGGGKREACKKSTIVTPPSEYYQGKG